MRLDKEGRRTVAQFLNGLAAGMVATLVLAPLAGGTLRPGLAAAAVVGAAINTFRKEGGWHHDRTARSRRDDLCVSSSSAIQTAGKRPIPVVPAAS